MTSLVTGFGCRPITDLTTRTTGPAFESRQGRCYGGSGEDIASIGADVSPMEHPMRKPNDLSRSMTVLNPETTLIAVIEMSQSSWYPASSGSSPA